MTQWINEPVRERLCLTIGAIEQAHRRYLLHLERNLGITGPDRSRGFKISLIEQIILDVILALQSFLDLQDTKET